MEKRPDRTEKLDLVVLKRGCLVALHKPSDKVADHSSAEVNGHLILDPAAISYDQVFGVLRLWLEAAARPVPESVMCASLSPKHSCHRSLWVMATDEPNERMSRVLREFQEAVRTELQVPGDQPAP
jgi:hypothetical protein